MDDAAPILCNRRFVFIDPLDCEAYNVSEDGDVFQLQEAEQRLFRARHAGIVPLAFLYPGAGQRQMVSRHDFTRHVPRDISEALTIQHCIRKRIRIIPLTTKPALVAGVDAAFFDGEVVAAASLFTYPEMQHVRDSVYRGKTSFPYIPGLFFFREGPVALRALRQLKVAPDVILIDGQGIAHPRGAGIASHLGVLLDVPAIGCAKSGLFGDFEEPGRTKGDWSYLYREGDQSRIGAVLRTRTGVKPVFVSPGHLIDIGSAMDIVLGCASQYRIPEPLRRAHRLAQRMGKCQDMSNRP
jgi:deoxyribonuclease V